MTTEISLSVWHVTKHWMELSNCRFFFVRAGMMGWLFINLSVLAKSIQDDTLSKSMILYQLFCAVISKTCRLFSIDWKKTIILCLVFEFLHVYSSYTSWTTLYMKSTWHPRKWVASFPLQDYWVFQISSFPLYIQVCSQSQPKHHLSASRGKH